MNRLAVGLNFLTNSNLDLKLLNMHFSHYDAMF